MTDTITDAADTFAFASLVDDAPISFRKWLPPCGIRPRASVQITHGVAAVSPVIAAPEPIAAVVCNYTVNESAMLCATTAPAAPVRIMEGSDR